MGVDGLRPGSEVGATLELMHAIETKTSARILLKEHLNPGHAAGVTQ
jgi:hypothetical protein